MKKLKVMQKLFETRQLIWTALKLSIKFRKSWKASWMKERSKKRRKWSLSSWRWKILPKWLINSNKCSDLKILISKYRAENEKRSSMTSRWLNTIDHENESKLTVMKKCKLLSWRNQTQYFKLSDFTQLILSVDRWLLTFLQIKPLQTKLSSLSKIWPANS